MASHKTSLNWQRDGEEFKPGKYSTDHPWTFDGGESVMASAAAAYGGNAALVDPEQAFTASLSACHMLTFLYMAASKGFVINSYQDDAEGFLGKNDEGRMAMVRVVLKPRIEFDGEAPDTATMEQLHHRAHLNCFIANSVSTQIDIE